MNILTRPTGRYPLGIWIVWALLIVLLFLGIIGQLISVASWDTALDIGLQEDDPDSKDALEQSLVPVEWGVAVADLLLQTPALLLAALGILRKHWIGLLGATAEFTILLYAGLFFFFQRYGIKVWDVGDWTHWRGIAIFFLVLAGSIGLIGLICTWSNRDYFLRAEPGA
ncbi:MAG: hypothetical protein JXJ20_13980 [Anaerolineae bacterium]|nr:hypothetical protein [Anaerolineae bacterium]